MATIGVKTYQRMVKAAKDVSEGKTGAKLKLKSATKAYVDQVTKTAKKAAEDKISDAKKRAVKVSGIAKRKPAAKKATTKRKPAAKKPAAKRTSTRTTTRRR